MDNPNTDVNDLIGRAREALRRGDKETARQLGEQAALRMVQILYEAITETEKKVLG